MALNLDSSSILLGLLLGTVQAITEFLPISSSGHLVMVETLIASSPNSLAFDVGLHIGTLIAILVSFKSTISSIILACLKRLSKTDRLTQDERHYSKIGLLLIIGTIPATITGLLFIDIIELYLREPWLIAMTLALGAVIMWIADRNAAHLSKMSDFDLRGVTIIGCAQAIALVPGMSRSAMTISAARLLGHSRQQAAKFSFLLAVPVIIGAGTLTGLRSFRSGLPIDWDLLLIGSATAFFIGILVIKLFLSYLEKYNLSLFISYRIILAALIAIGILTKNVM